MCAERSVKYRYAYLLSAAEAVSAVDRGADQIANAGDTVSLVYTITNTGNTCLRDVEVVDPSAGELLCSSEYSGECPRLGWTGVWAAPRWQQD